MTFQAYCLVIYKHIINVRIEKLNYKFSDNAAEEGMIDNLYFIIVLEEYMIFTLPRARFIIVKTKSSVIIIPHENVKNEIFSFVLFSIRLNFCTARGSSIKIGEADFGLSTRIKFQS